VSRFQPCVGTFLRFGSASFEFVPHPLFPRDKDAVFVLEGAEAFVYQVRQRETGRLYAFKVFKSAYRDERIARVTAFLAQQADIPGLDARRICVTTNNYPELVQAFPAVEYALLMPWVEAPTWAGVLLDPAISVRYTFDEARDLALATAHALWNIESRRLAHTDIAGNNVLLSADRKQIQLLDLEGMYVPGWAAPKKCSRGTPGYQHRNPPGTYGQHCPEGDRFAGTMLLTEMLTWWEPRVRARVADHAETLFRPDELQVMGSSCWQVVREVLYSIHPGILSLFDQAWASSTLAACPTLATWAKTLVATFHETSPHSP
jgi:serine/threonine protein kinase